MSMHVTVYRLYLVRITDTAPNMLYSRVPFHFTNDDCATHLFSNVCMCGLVTSLIRTRSPCCTINLVNGRASNMILHVIDCSKKKAYLIVGLNLVIEPATQDDSA